LKAIIAGKDDEIEQLRNTNNEKFKETDSLKSIIAEKDAEIAKLKESNP
jgi:hypothetical protein